MSFQFASASSQYLFRTNVVYSIPLTLYCEAMPFQTNADNIVLSQGTGVGPSIPHYCIWFYHDGYVYAYKDDYAAPQCASAKSVVPYAANAWHRVGAMFDAAGMRVWVNGHGPGSGSACSAVNASDTDYTVVGTLLTNGNVMYPFNGRVAFPCAWPISLNDAQCKALSGGELLPEEIRPDVLAGFWPGGGRYGRNYLDFSGRKPPVPMSPVNGPTWGSDPWRRSPSRRLVVPAAVATGAGAQLHYNRCLRVA